MTNDLPKGTALHLGHGSPMTRERVEAVGLYASEAS